MDDSISRQDAIDILNVGAELLRRVLDDTDIVGAERAKYEWGLGLIESYISDMKELPSADASLMQDRCKIDASSNLISRQALRDAMYHEAFETDTEMQKWDSGCWIRYKLFENVIDNLPSVEVRTQMSSADLISREAAITALLGITPIQHTIPLVSAIFNIKKLPSAERVGHWIHPYHYGLALPEHQCSECGYWEYKDTKSNYCPNCGAHMEEEEE